MSGIETVVNVGNGLAPDDGTGDNLREGADKINFNKDQFVLAINNLAASQAGGMISYLLKSDMTADLAHADGVLATVTNDPTDANNGVYRKSGASGSGSWVLTIDRVTIVKNDLASTAAGKGAALVGFLQAGAGSVARTQLDKSQDMVSPFDKMTPAQAADARSGAKTLDLTAPIQAAIDTGVARGIPVDFRGVVAAKVTALTVGAGGKLVGNGAKLDFSAAGAVTGITCGSGVSITGFGGLNGPGYASFSANNSCIVAKGVVNSGAAPTFITGPLVQNNIITNWGAYGVYLEHCISPDVQWNTITGINYAGIGGMGCVNGHADNNVVDTVGPGTGGNAYAIFWSRLKTAPTEVENPRSYSCTANKNVVSNCSTWEGIDTHSGVDIQMNDNVFDNVKVAIAMVPSAISGVEALAPIRCKARGNTMKNSPNGVVISISGAFPSIVTEYALNCEASDNKIEGGGVSGSGVNGVVRLLGTEGFKASGNEIKNGGPFGFCLLNDNLNFSITGGTIMDMNDASVTTCSGVAVRDHTNTGYVGGINFVRKNTALPNVMVNSVLVSPGITDAEVKIGPCKFTGDTSASLTINITSGSPLCNASMAATQSGTGTLSQVSGAASNLVDITFVAPLPAIPKVTLSRTSAGNTGGKAPDIQVTSITRSGFRVIARPYDLSTWSASGSLTFNWSATL